METQCKILGTCQCCDDCTSLLRQRKKFRVSGILHDWAPPCSTTVRVFFGGGVIGVFTVAALRALDIVASTGGPPGTSSKSAISSASSSSITEEVWRICLHSWIVWARLSGGGPASGFHRFMLTCGTGMTRSWASPGLSGLASPSAVLARNSLEPSAALASPSLQIRQHDEIWPALGPSSVPRLSLLHRRLLLLHLVFQDADACFGQRRCFCLCQLLPGQCKSLHLSACLQGKQHPWRILHPVEAKRRSATTL